MEFPFCCLNQQDTKTASSILQLPSQKSAIGTDAPCTTRRAGWTAALGTSLSASAVQSCNAVTVIVDMALDITTRIGQVFGVVGNVAQTGITSITTLVITSQCNYSTPEIHNKEQTRGPVPGVCRAEHFVAGVSRQCNALQTSQPNSVQDYILYPSETSLSFTPLCMFDLHDIFPAKQGTPAFDICKIDVSFIPKSNLVPRDSKRIERQHRQ